MKSKGWFYLSISFFFIVLFLFCIRYYINVKRSAAKKIVIGAVLKYDKSPYFREVEDGLRETAEGNNATIIVMAPDERDSKKQGLLATYLINSSVNALILAPVNKDDCIPVILSANGKKIPVVLIDTGFNEEVARLSGARIDSVIIGDDEKGGRLAADYMAKRISGGGCVLIVEGLPGSFTGDRRKNGFVRQMLKYPQFETMISPPALFEREKSFDACSGLLKQKKDIKGIFALNDMMALGASDAVKASPNRNICVIGYGATKYGLNAVKEKRIEATIDLFPMKLGKIAVETAIKCLRNEAVSPKIVIEPKLITHDMMQQPFQ